MHMRAVQSGSETLVSPGSTGNTIKSGAIQATHEATATALGMPVSEMIWLYAMK